MDPQRGSQQDAGTPVALAEVVVVVAVAWGEGLPALRRARARTWTRTRVRWISRPSLPDLDPTRTPPPPPLHLRMTLAGFAVRGVGGAPRDSSLMLRAADVAVGEGMGEEEDLEVEGGEVVEEDSGGKVRVTGTGTGMATAMRRLRRRRR